MRNRWAPGWEYSTHISSQVLRSGLKISMAANNGLGCPDESCDGGSSAK